MHVPTIKDKAKRNIHTHTYYHRNKIDGFKIYLLCPKRINLAMNLYICVSRFIARIYFSDGVVTLTYKKILLHKYAQI